jgi:WD40 repeat protein
MRKSITAALFFFVAIATTSGQEVIVLGAAGQGGELGLPGGPLEGPDGNIYIYDESDAFIKVFSPQGQFLRKMAGEGQGPGEIQRRDSVSIGFTSDGKLYFTEYFRGHRWITHLKLDGELDRVLKIDLPGSFGIPDAVALPDGGFLVEFHILGEPVKQKDYFLYKSPIKLSRLNAGGRIVAEIRSAEHLTRISYRPDGADSPIPFVPSFAWCSYGRDKILFSDGQSHIIEVYDLGGKRLPDISTDLPEPEKVRDKDLDRWREDRKREVMEINPGWWHQSGSVVEKYSQSLYKFKPLIGGLASTPEGDILVSGSWDSDEASRQYWLLDGSGKILAQLKAAAGRIRLSKNFVFIETSDSDGNVRVSALKRSGSDKDDFLKSARAF